MTKEREYNQRHGRGVKWQMFGEFTVNTGYTIDDLDSKDLSDARNSFEKVFITIRKALETKESCCLDNEEERLQICQVLSETLNPMIKRGEFSE